MIIIFSLAHRRHNAAVRQLVPEEQLLVFHVGEGWDRLCNFLGVKLIYFVHKILSKVANSVSECHTNFFVFIYEPFL